MVLSSDFLPNMRNPYFEEFLTYTAKEIEFGGRIAIKCEFITNFYTGMDQMYELI